MDTDELNELVDGWLAYWEARVIDKHKDSGVWDEDNLSPDQTVDSWRCDENFEPLWEFILAAYPREMSDRVFSILAAGPLEDLIADAGPAFIDRIETKARQDPKFRQLLGGVWRSASKPEVWARIEAIRDVPW